MDADVIVIGAGAAGLWAAERVARGGAKVLLLEKTPRAGTKILASGGSRCNLTTTLGPEPASALFGEAKRFIQPSLRALSPQAVRKRFEKLGVPTVEEPHLEKVFPRSQRAVDVRDALVREAIAAGVEIRYRCAVASVEPAQPGWWVHAGPVPLRCAALILSAGGQSYPRTGTTGDAYPWLRALGLTVVHPVPALVPVRSAASWVHALSGVSVQTTEVRALDATGRVLARRARPVLFTHHGLSGPGAMDLSELVARSAADRLAIDLAPGIADDALRARLHAAATRPDGPRLVRLLAETLSEGLPARLVSAALRQASIDDDNPSLYAIDKGRRNRLVDALKGLIVPVRGTMGWDEAEVTAGGLARDALDRRTMAVGGYAGLYVIGELLDVTGPIGGLNFQAAFATAQAAADALRR